MVDCLKANHAMQEAKEDSSEPALYHQWRVAVDDPAAIHVEDLILVQLKQVSQGSWIPEIYVSRPVYSSLPMVEATVGYPTTSLSHTLSTATPSHIPQDRRERAPVPLRTWKPNTKQRRELRTIEFWTKDKAKESPTPGTYFADHLDNNPDRSLIDSESFPLDGKFTKKKQFTLHILVGSALLLPRVTELTLGIG